MKITVDTKAKTIQLQENIKLVDLVEELDKLGINEEEYTLIIEPIITYPINPWYVPYNPTITQPWEQQPITWQTSTSDRTVTNKVPETVTYTTNIHYDSRNK